MSFAEIKQEDRRLLILKALAAENDYSISDMVLRGLLAEYGHSLAMDVLHVDLAWLKDIGLLSIEKVSTLAVATITQRGEDVAAGRAVIPGIRRPRPGE